MSGLIIEELRTALVDYNQGWDLQRRIHAEVVGGSPDHLLLLQHSPVYTAGRRTEPHERPWPLPTDAAVIDVDRGGKITWHGPGQLVGYPIVRLREPLDVVAFVRRIEQLLIDVCIHFGVNGQRVDGRSGVWVGPDSRGPARKIAAIGIRVAQGVTMHGFALNCDCDLGWFDRIVPCGISDATVTSLTKECGRPVTVDEVLPVLRAALATATLA
ncbi:MAG: lipoyl(octanoyl) transferase LipB [Actinomycetales bacterium]|nr:lipoyl(octanoyl) transferase LipB [Actinomycetales bacterium]